MMEEIFEDNLIGDLNNLDDIVELHAEQDEDDPGPSADNNNEDGADDENADTGGTPVEPKKKRVVRNPQPKLDPERLKGPRGIAVLENVFKDFKFYGKGHEREDLNRVMKQLEHWAHRLFPRFQFDDCLEKIEKLGQKKPVQVYVKKIRMGMETVEEPVVLRDDDEEEEVLQDGDEAPIDAFDELIGQQLSQIKARTPTPAKQNTGLTAEQRERMLRNRLLAEERRLARMKVRREQEKSSDTAANTTNINNQTEREESPEHESSGLNKSSSCVNSECRDEASVDSFQHAQQMSVADVSETQQETSDDTQEIIPADVCKNRPVLQETNEAVPMPVDADLAVTNKPEQNLPSMSTDSEESSSACVQVAMSVDDDLSNPTTMSVDNDQISECPMPVDNEQKTPTSMTVDAEQDEIDTF